jgi:hypothetical protein
MSKKSELVTRIKRRLGYPMIKIEMNDDQINDNINYARTKFIKYAAGQATQEVYFTMMLSGGQSLYDMPDGTVEIIGYDCNNSDLGGINTLFTLGNYLYSQGAYGILGPGTQSGGFYIISYYIFRDFMGTLERYNPDGYRYRYHRSANLLEIDPAPPIGGSFVLNDIEYDSPGFILVRANMIDGSILPDYAGINSLDNNLYESQWIEDYSTAMTKLTLGLIRRKFANFSALGNQGASMDGGELISEAKEDISALEDSLLLRENYVGWPVIVGALALFLLNYSGIITFLCM